ncbi:unnamed protein product, partial [Ectocarpus sp. 4 AP-2014]
DIQVLLCCYGEYHADALKSADRSKRPAASRPGTWFHPLATKRALCVLSGLTLKTHFEPITLCPEGTSVRGTSLYTLRSCRLFISLSVAAFQSFASGNSMASLKVFGMVLTFSPSERPWI